MLSLYYQLSESLDQWTMVLNEGERYGILRGISFCSIFPHFSLHEVGVPFLALLVLESSSSSCLELTSRSIAT
jgi:hypothetical protein